MRVLARDVERGLSTPARLSGHTGKPEREELHQDPTPPFGKRHGLHRVCVLSLVDSLWESAHSLFSGLSLAQSGGRGPVANRGMAMVQDNQGKRWKRPKVSRIPAPHACRTRAI